MKPTKDWFLVDYETQTIIGFGSETDMVAQQQKSHGNLFVVARENLTKEMRIALGEEMKTTYQEVLTLLLSVAPNATVSVDDDGQVVIHTNLTDIGGTGYLEEMQ